MSQKKIGPDRFSRFDVYWIQTNKQTNKQTDKPNLYIDTVMFGRLRSLETLFSETPCISLRRVQNLFQGFIR